MSNLAIKVETLSKVYKIGVADRHDTLRDQIASSLRMLFARNGRGSPTQAKAENIWALKDVSFEVNHGEVLGVIGGNGAGKSTLLKILSRITEPTVGFAEIHGRVGSLLEVGTGFHGELTGRENIYLNGAILGMKKVEIDRKFDEIVDFSDIEKFIDTPVKRYSSGMYVRLAFAVAAHLEPEILIVDEVLAVGDVRFQKKCLNRMQDVGRKGRTVLFVSHNMRAISSLCERAILLDGGTILADDAAHKVVSSYLNLGSGTRAAREWPDPAKAPGGEVVCLRAVRVRTEDGRTTDTVDIRRPVGIEMEYEVLLPGYILSPYYNFNNEEGMRIFSATDHDPSWRRKPRPRGRYVSTAWIPGNFLSEGRLFVGVGLATMSPLIYQFEERDVVSFQVMDSFDGDAARGDWGGSWGGVVRPLLEWTTQFTPDEDKASVTLPD